MKRDPIIQSVQQAKDRLAKGCDNDVRTLAESLQTDKRSKRIRKPEATPSRARKSRSA